MHLALFFFSIFFLNIALGVSIFFYSAKVITVLGTRDS